MHVFLSLNGLEIGILHEHEHIMERMEKCMEIQIEAEIITFDDDEMIHMTIHIIDILIILKKDSDHVQSDTTYHHCENGKNYFLHGVVKEITTAVLD